MVGANYMGGSKNAAKARWKDTTRRTQKSFFGNQRFNILAKGLRGNNTGTIDQPQPEGRAGINLAHARRERTLLEARTGGDRLAFPGMKENASPRRNETNTGKTRLESKVLDALDTTETLSLRAEMKRILAMPDLAGLSDCRAALASSKATRVPLKRPHSQTTSFPTSRQNKRQKRDDEPSDKAEISVQTRSSESLTSFGDDERSVVYVPIKPAMSTSPGVVGSPTLDAFIREYDTDPTLAANRDDFGRESNVEDSDFPTHYESTQFSVCGYSDFEAGLSSQGRVIGQEGIAEDERFDTRESQSFLPRLSSPFEEDVILNMDTSFPSSGSSLGLSVSQIPERPIFSRRHPAESFAATLTGRQNLPLLAPTSSVTSLSGVVRGLHPGIALTINQPPSAPTFRDESGEARNLFDEDDPWGTIGEILGVESTQPGADDMTSIMHTRPRLDR